MSRPPSRDEIARYAARQHLNLSAAELEAEVPRVAAFLHVLDRLADLDDPQATACFPPRDEGRAPTPAEDPYNAIVRFCHASGAEDGPLAGMRIGVKDNIAVAGVPMTAGVPGRRAFMPTEDAVVVERLLDAGGDIVAKTSIDAGLNLTRNPLDPRFHAGGSSSGSAAAVAAGLVDAALGVDEGGSIRIPAAWCGVVGMKATHGLVPSYGLTYWDHTLDHIGPLTRDVADNARMLEVIAGHDWRDPQWGRTELGGVRYSTAAGMGVRDLRVGVISEALSRAGCTEELLEAFREAEGVLADLGAEVVPVTVPLWEDTPVIWLAIVTSGLTAMGESFGQGYGHLGRVDLEQLSFAATEYFLGRRWLPFEGRTLPLVFEHVRTHLSGIPFGRAHNLRLELRRQIDDLLRDVDVLITPTTPTGPVALADEDGRAGDGSAAVVLPDVSARSGSVLSNCCTANLTGHPALSVPSRRLESGHPTALQIIGRRYDEHTVYRAGFAFEAALQTRGLDA